MSSQDEPKERSLESLYEAARTLAIQADCSEVVSTFTAKGWTVRIGTASGHAGTQRTALVLALADAGRAASQARAQSRASVAEITRAAVATEKRSLS